MGKCAVSLDTYGAFRQPFLMNTSKNTEAIHPGAYIKREVIDPLEINVSDAARALGVTRPALSALLNGRADLSSEMALRIEKAFGVPMDRLVHMQADWNIAEQRKKTGDVKVLAYRPMQKPKLQGGLF